MAKRFVNDSFWTDPEVKPLSFRTKGLFLYFITNPHGHISGIYYLPVSTIQEETGLSAKELKQEIHTLSVDYRHTLYHPNFSVVWVRKMLQHQVFNDKVKTNIENHLLTLHKCPLIQDFLDYYDSLSIEYPYSLSQKIQLYFNTILAASNAYNSGYAKAGISFQAKYNAAGAVATLAGISGGKENTTDDNYASFLGLYTRANGGNTTEQVRISSAGNVGIATTDLDGTPAVGRLTVKGTTNDGTTQVQVWRDSDEANVANLNTNGDFYVAADVSALTFTDRTSAFEGDALAAIMAIKSVDGELDHSTLHPFAQKTIVKRQNKFTTEVSVEDAYETVDVEEDEMEEITDENGEAKKQPRSEEHTSELQSQ